jgi:two-component system cell cycle response regulator DivK
MELLLIDDDLRNTFALKAVLKAKGLICITATSAEEGLSILYSKNNIGIILMDMMMPDMDGYQAISQIRNSEKYADIPIVAVTAQAMVGDKEKCLAAGANAYISKPINVDLLMGVLNNYL